MAYFIKHKLIKDDDGYILELYIDQRLNEFSLDFLGVNKKEKQQDGGGNLNIAVTQYIKEKLPNLKITAVNIMLGAILIASVPYHNVVAAATSVNVAAQNETVITYSVKTGETLYLISKKFKTTVTLLKYVNGLTGDMIYVGQKLKIPGNSYIVKAGDSLYKISRKFGVSVVQLKQENRITGDIIYTGQNLKIPYIINNNASVLVLVNKKNNLPSGYVPTNLSVPNIRFSFAEYDNKKLMRSDAADALEGMFMGAEKAGVKLYALSAYRSFDRQQGIFTSSVSRNGIEKANRFSAMPGQSEHQTGLAMDLTAPSVNYGLSQDFGGTAEGKWLSDNAYKYGFIIRYQRGRESITGYQYEPWHVRFVGKAAAKEISSRNITLEEYLGIL